MTIEITGPPEAPASDPPDALKQNGVHTQDQASDTTVPITEAEVALGTAAATGVRRKDVHQFGGVGAKDVHSQQL